MIDPEIGSAIKIQSIWRRFWTRYRDVQARMRMRVHHDNIVEVGDCVFHNNKHPMTLRGYVYDCYFCDWCEYNIDTDRYACALGCNFDLCLECGVNYNHNGTLKNFVEF